MFKLFSKVLSGKFKSLLFEEMANNDDISWYHGNITRDEAEDILKQAALSGEAPSNGLFLVRDSSSTPGDFVLSVLTNGEVMNFQIRRHGEDAFFSINQQTIFHGLETLIDCYKNEDHGLPCLLIEPLKKDKPPPNTLRHGRTNLLHRATKEGNLKIVTELVKCGYRNIEAKNEDGLTAVHLACKQGEDSILEKLIESGANVNCRDVYGNTPLHYACQNNYPNVVRILLNHGANVQLRNTETEWVALHEAASRGHKDICEHLLRVGAPSRPRTKEKKTPQQLAVEHGFFQLADMIKTHEGPKPNTTKEDWYHGTLSRQEAVALLRNTNAPNTDGRFLVRFSEQTGHVLTMMYFNEPYHYVISVEGKFYMIDDGPLMDSLEHLVAHYSAMPDGLPTILQTPVRPKPKPPLPSFHPSFTLPTKGRKGFRWSEGSNIMTLPPKTKPRKSFDANMNDAKLALPPPNQVITPQIFISQENLILKEVIGEGEFGSVHKAVYQHRDGSEVEVAVKTLHPDHTANREAFLKEADVMLKLNHHCIVKLIGISRDSSFLMVQELIPLGSMLAFILTQPEQVSPDYELHVWASQIACGMQYLESNRLVHRDLAARNILLATRHQAKISDFGLSRMLEGSREYYRATKGGRWPIKWYAPESYNYGTFSSASDVWSFGVTLWEMFSYGDQPYGERKGTEVIGLIDQGYRLERPELCPQDVYEMMEKCWNFEPLQRPSFSELYEFFASHTNYENVRDLVPKTDIS